MKEAVCLRLDDVGACSKRYEIYSDYRWKLTFRGKTLRIFGKKLKFFIGNWLFLKYLPELKGWGPYNEMTVGEWYQVYEILEKFHAKLTVAVTAAWAENEHHLIPFPEQFPEEAGVLKEGVQQGLIEIANHGLTHCVVKNNLFKPKWFSGNRQYHREFWDWLPDEVHNEHLRRSQEILQTYIQTDVVTFVPPGNVFAERTLECAERYGLRYVSCDTTPGMFGKLTIVGNEQIIPFHDRDLVVHGIKWLQQLLEPLHDKRFCFIKDFSKIIS